MSPTRNSVTALAITSIALLSTAGVAGAAHISANAYPPPKNPTIPSTAPKGPFKTRTVCAKGCAYKTIQSAVNASKAGDTVKVKAGTYKERVVIKGKGKAFLKLIGDPKSPGKVLLEGKGSKPATQPNNGVTINGADQVTVNGFTARDYSGYGFFVVNNNGYLLTNLVAKFVGVYGIYAFNSVGGTMSNSTAAWNNDSGFYIGQTPPQTKPIRSYVRNVTAYGNVLGFSGTNSKYVTITQSRWFNNGLGIVPNALDSEKYAPPDQNVITDNDVFFNNWDYFAGAPFKLRASATDIPYPVGTGILLFGGRNTEVSKNRVYGNYLMGVGAIQQLLLKQADAKDLIGNRIMNNVFGNDGKNPNGRDLFYDGDGSNNCIGPNTGVQVTVPADASTFAPCPFTGTNAFSADAQGQAVNWTVTDPTHEAFWIKNAQTPIPGVTPLEHWTTSIGVK